MKILQIYEKYSLTKTLQEHMIRAAAVGKIISENSPSINVHPERIIKVLLLHDIGNIIKFDLDKFPKLLGNDISRIEYWKNIQKKFITKYGNDEHKATELIAREIGVNSDIQSLLERQIYTPIKKIAQGMDWEAKICQYADLRSGPFGIVSIDERFDDLIDRYKHRNHKISNTELTNENRKYMIIIEEQIQRHSKLSLRDISEASVSSLYPEISEIEIASHSKKVS